MEYNEAHYHGPFGGVEVLSKAKIWVEKVGKYLTKFKLIQGRGEVLSLDYKVHLGPEAIAEMF